GGVVSGGYVRVAVVDVHVGVRTRGGQVGVHRAPEHLDDPARLGQPYPLGGGRNDLPVGGLNRHHVEVVVALQRIALIGRGRGGGGVEEAGRTGWHRRHQRRRARREVLVDTAVHLVLHQVVPRRGGRVGVCRPVQLRAGGGDGGRRGQGHPGPAPG